MGSLAGAFPGRCPGSSRAATGAEIAARARLSRSADDLVDRFDIYLGYPCRSARHRLARAALDYRRARAVWLRHFTPAERQFIRRWEVGALSWRDPVPSWGWSWLSPDDLDWRWRMERAGTP